MRDIIETIIGNLLRLNAEITERELNGEIKEYQNKMKEYIGIISKQKERIKELELEVELAAHVESR